MGEPVIFQWVEAIRDYLNDLAERSNEGALTSEMDNYENIYMGDIEIHCTDVAEIDITHGEMIVDRKSTFQGHVAAVEKIEHVKTALNQLKDNKKIANATHNIYAYRIEKNEKCMVQDCEDDGETHAGRRLLQLLQMMNLTNVLVVVSRWYGGVHLGPDRFRHINNAARSALLDAGYKDRKK